MDVFLGFRFADLVDIAVVSMLLYAALALIRQTRAAFVAIGILIVGALYVGASALDLRLTAWIFQGFFAVSLIVVVVVFQEELRQLFERIALWSLRRQHVETLATDPSDILVNCLTDFARDRTGALVVIPGSRPIQRYVQGGIELDGKISIPLLKSLFDAHSPGHDGAVIIENGRVKRFAAHLPLSTDFSQLANVGTRHSAALGLAERTDALCLVVSEERGQVSVARDGKLRRLANSQLVGSAVQGFFRDKLPQTANGNRLWTQLFRGQRTEKAVVLALVVALWTLFVPGSRTVTVSYEVPITVLNLPADLEVEKIEPPSAQATFSGVRRAFYLFRSDRLELPVDGSLAKYGRRTFRLTAQDMNYPENLTLQGIEPIEVRLTLRSAGEGDSENRADAADEASGAAKSAEGP